MAKTPSKGKKPAAKEPAAPKAKKEKAPKAVKPAEPAALDEDLPEGDELDDEDEDEDEEEVAAKPAAKKPAQPAPAAKPKTTEPGEAPAVVPARRLTPEAKAKVNEMVAKGMSLSDALKAAASWETFVAPVKDEPAKLVQGKSFDGGAPKPRFRAEEEPEGPDLEDDEPAAEAEE